MDIEDKTWTHSQAVELARAVEAIIPDFGAHVALTGGSLYKDGERKDADLIIYRVRQVPTIDEAGMFAALEAIGLKKTADFGFVKKADFNGKSVDLLFPEQCKPTPDPERSPY